MANLLSNPVYVTKTDIKDTTNISELKWDNNIDRYITEAQYIIDSYILTFWSKFDIEQKEIFPIKDYDWTSVIPDDIKLATIYIVEDIFLSWIPTVASWNDIVSEKVGDHSVSYSKDTKSELYIPEKAKNILDQYRTIFFKSIL